MTQHQLVLHTPDGRPMPAVWAYRLYAWLLTRMPREEGDWLHQTGEHPISQFLSYDKDTQQMVWTVNLLCTELETRLSPPLLETNTIDLHGCPISVERQTIRKVPGPEALIFQGREQCRKRVEIRFLTPTAFKQAGRYAIFPQERLLLQSLLGRWNYLCPDYPLTDEDAISALLEGLHIVDYALRTTRYRMKWRRSCRCPFWSCGALWYALRLMAGSGSKPHWVWGVRRYPSKGRIRLPFDRRCPCK